LLDTKDTSQRRTESIVECLDPAIQSRLDFVCLKHQHQAELPSFIEVNKSFATENGEKGMQS